MKKTNLTYLGKPTPAPTSPEEYDAFVKSEVSKWSKVIKDAGIKFD